MQVPLALEFVSTDATLKVELIAGHVNVLQVLLEVTRGAIGALADGAGQGLKAAHDPWGWRERRAVSPGEPGSSNSSSTAAQHQQRATATPPSHHKPTASCPRDDAYYAPDERQSFSLLLRRTNWHVRQQGEM